MFVEDKKRIATLSVCFYMKIKENYMYFRLNDWLNIRLLNKRIRRI